MSKQKVDGVWVVVCDWTDPDTGKLCDLGHEGEPRMAVDPDAGQKPDTHFQCGAHHGIVKQEHRPEFQLPKDHKLNKEVVRLGRPGDTVTVEVVEDE